MHKKVTNLSKPMHIYSKPNRKTYPTIKTFTQSYENFMQRYKKQFVYRKDSTLGAVFYFQLSFSILGYLCAPSL